MFVDENFFVDEGSIWLSDIFVYVWFMRLASEPLYNQTGAPAIAFEVFACVRARSRTAGLQNERGKQSEQGEQEEQALPTARHPWYSSFQ